MITLISRVINNINPSLDYRIEKVLRKEKSQKDQQLLEPRRSGRIIKQPNSFLGMRESYDFVGDKQQYDPFTYK